MLLTSKDLQVMAANHVKGDFGAVGVPADVTDDWLMDARSKSTRLEHVWTDQLRRRDGISVVGR